MSNKKKPKTKNNKQKTITVTKKLSIYYPLSFLSSLIPFVLIQQWEV